MADFRTDTSAIKVEPNKGMSLADMLNIQKSSYELSKIKELYPAMISEQQAKSRTAQVGANVAEQTQQPNISKAISESKRLGIEAEKAGVDLSMHFGNLTKSMLGAYASDPDFINVNTPEILKKIKSTQK